MDKQRNIKYPLDDELIRKMPELHGLDELPQVSDPFWQFLLTIFRDQNPTPFLLKIRPILKTYYKFGSLQPISTTICSCEPSSLRSFMQGLCTKVKKKLGCLPTYLLGCLNALYLIFKMRKMKNLNPCYSLFWIIPKKRFSSFGQRCSELSYAAVSMISL